MVDQLPINFIGRVNGKEIARYSFIGVTKFFPIMVFSKIVQ